MAVNRDPLDAVQRVVPEDDFLVHVGLGAGLGGHWARSALSIAFPSPSS